MRFAAGIRAGSDGAPSRRDYGWLGAVFGLGLPVLFGGVVIAATEPPPLGHYAAGVLLLVVVPAALVALTRARLFLWLR